MERIQEQEHEPHGSALLLAGIGSVALGATAGSDRGVFAVLRDAATLPASIALVLAVLVPALYIASSMTGVVIRLPDLGIALLAGLRAAGLASLGVVAPLLFLMASTEDHVTSRILIALSLLAVGLLGLRAIYSQLYGRTVHSVSIIALYLSWSAVFLGLAAKISFATLVI